MALTLVYATFPDRDTATKLAKQVLKKRLAACVTFWDAASLYWWEGELEETTETLAFFKTSGDQVDRLTEALADAHPYDVPCIVPLHAMEGHRPYVQWVEGEVHGVE